MINGQTKILGVIGAFGAGSSIPIIALLLGKSIGDYSKTSESRLKDMSYQEKRLIFSEFRDASEDIVYKFLWVGALISFAMFISTFIWEYVGLKQIQNLKEKYKELIEESLRICPTDFS